jgi:DNA-binding MarR family transcriptional regulator
MILLFAGGRRRRKSMGRGERRDINVRRARTLAAVSRELQRVNRSLRRLAGATPQPDASLERETGITSASVRAIIAARRLRNDRFGPAVGDLAWALLLEAFAARLEGRLTAMTSLGAASGIARSTAHRWVGWLLARGLLIRGPDPADERVTLVGLSDGTAERIRAYLAEAGGKSLWPS